MSDSKLTRRDLCRHAACIVPMSFVVASNIGIADAAKPAAPGLTKFVSVKDDPVAKALNYTEDAKNGKREKRGKVEGKDQFCDNCQLYTPVGKIEGKEAGKCQLIQGGAVHAAGWCNSWVMKG